MSTSAFESTAPHPIRLGNRVKNDKPKVVHQRKAERQIGRFNQGIYYFPDKHGRLILVVQLMTVKVLRAAVKLVVLIVGDFTVRYFHRMIYELRV
jgi:hypothetical protein